MDQVTDYHIWLLNLNPLKNTNLNNRQTRLQYNVGNVDKLDTKYPAL